MLISKTLLVIRDDDSLNDTQLDAVCEALDGIDFQGIIQFVLPVEIAAHVTVTTEQRDQ